MKIIIAHISSRKSHFLFVLGRMLGTIKLIILTLSASAQRVNYAQKLHVEILRAFLSKASNYIK